MANTTNTTSVTIKPGKMSSYATAVRGCINEVLAFARTADEDDMLEALVRLRINVPRLETEAKLVVKGE